MNVPYGALPGFSLEVDIREVASYYGLGARSLRRRDPRHGDVVLEAWRALIWKLTELRELSADRVAELLDTPSDEVAKAREIHRTQLEQFRRETGLSISVE